MEDAFFFCTISSVGKKKHLTFARHIELCPTKVR